MGECHYVRRVCKKKKKKKKKKTGSKIVQLILKVSVSLFVASDPGKCGKRPQISHVHA